MLASIRQLVPGVNVAVMTLSGNYEKTHYLFTLG